MKIKSHVSIAILLIALQSGFSQMSSNSFETPVQGVDTTSIEFTSLEEALKNPEKVYRLNLSNQNLILQDIAWSRFTNLTYLSFKNDHLKEIPKEIGNLPHLKILDLSGNDFKILPESIGNLRELEELYLNDDKYLDIDNNMSTLSHLPRLKILHLENNHLKGVPKNIKRLKQLEMLYLNDNDFISFPREVTGLKKLKYLDLKNNQLPQNTYEFHRNIDYGFKVKF